MDKIRDKYSCQVTFHDPNFECYPPVSSVYKEVFMAGFKKSETAAIGNGRNDVEMIRMAGLGIAVIGSEGCAGELISAAKIVCHDITA